MMKGSQNLSLNKEEMEEEEEDWEVSSKGNDEMEVKASSVPTHMNSRFFDGNYWELKERKLKELGLRENFQKNGHASGHKGEFPKEIAKYESLEENDNEDKVNHLNGKEKLSKDEHDLLNDLLFKKVWILFILFYLSLVRDV